MTQSTSTQRLFISVIVSDLDDSVEGLIEAVDDQFPALETALSTALSVSDVRLRTKEAPMWAQIRADCPSCGCNLVLNEPSLDFSNGAYAQAYCEDCSWWGRAEYRLIDLIDESDTELVAEGMITPSYHPY